MYGMRDRKFNRIHFESTATVMMGDYSFNAKTENLSLNGLFLRTERRVPVGRRAEITFDVPSASRGSAMTLNGVVVRYDVHGMAFQFKSIDHDSFSYLKTVISRKASQRMKTLYTA